MFREIKNRFLRYFVILIYSIVLFFCAVELNFLWLFGYTPNMQDIKEPSLSLPSEVYYSDGTLIGRFYKEDRSPVEYKDISPNVVHALVATEDVRFYKHHGIDFYGTVTSMLSTATGEKRGGSTITQQLAKNLFDTRSRKSQGLVKHIPLLRTIVYKTKEWITALKIEHVYQKSDIITLYLNTVPFSSRTFGIKTAALRYFNKLPVRLTPAEAATLIGMLKATSTYNPVLNPAHSLERRNVVLGQMLKYGYLSQADYETNSELPIALDLTYKSSGNQGDSYLREAVERWLRKWCRENKYDLYTDGLKIYTTIDHKMQQYAELAVAEKMKMLQRRFYDLWGDKTPWRDLNGNEIVNFIQKNEERLAIYPLLQRKFNNDPVLISQYFQQKKHMKVFTWHGERDTVLSSEDSIKYYAKLLNTGMMTIEPATGKIKDWVGGINFKYFNYDHVNQAKRQAGSTFKPFAYCTALDNGYTPCDKFTDQFVSIKYTDGGKQQVWEPKNATYVFTGEEMSLRRAMGASVNSVTAQLTQKVGWDKVVQYAHKCGIDSRLRSIPSVCLGTNDVSVYEMVKAYATFLNKGNRIDPILVTKITDKDGDKVATFDLHQEQVLSPEVAWLMLYMFRGGIDEPGGTSQALYEYPGLWKKDNQIGGKTGTSSGFADGWYMGITKDLITGIWVGHDDRSVRFTNAETGEGSHTALPIYGDFMQRVYADQSLGYTYGPFPKATVPITKHYDCPSPREETDSLATDSTLVVPDSLHRDETPQTQQDTANKPPKENKE